jgi:hypothetical protein
MIELEKYYKEENWNDFVKVFEKDQEKSNEELTLIDLINGNDQLARVIFESLGYESLNWVNQRIPALDNMKPIECITNSNLEKRLKVCLMRMNK